jgi:hypothetical protein
MPSPQVSALPWLGGAYVQRMLGYATAAMILDLYGHLLDDDLLGVAEALGKAIDSVAVSLRYPETGSKEDGACIRS